MKAKIDKDEFFSKAFGCKYDHDSLKVITKDDHPTEFGIFSGFASIYGNVDFAGDIVQKGAFKRSLNNSEGRTVIKHMHSQNDILGVGGLEDQSKGLHMHGELNLDVARAKEDMSLLRQKAITSLSIGYNIIDAEYDEKGFLLLKELRLREVSLVDLPCNDLCDITSVKKFALNPDSFIEGRVLELYRGLIRAKDSGVKLSISDTLLSNLTGELKSLCQDCDHVIEPDSVIHSNEEKIKEGESDRLILGIDNLIKSISLMKGEK